MPFDFDEAYRLSTWKSLPLRRFVVPVEGLRDALPDFERRPMGTPPHDNPRLRLIVRTPEPHDPFERPVAAVSDRYDLLQHRVVATWLAENIEDAGLRGAEAAVAVTEYGERLRVTIPLPDRDRPLAERASLDFFDEDDRYRPEIEVTNSVDRSSAFRVCVRWRRLVCLNGLFTVEEDRMRSVHHVALSQTRLVKPFLAERLRGVPDVLARLGAWKRTAIDPKTAQRWCEERLRGRPGWSVETCARLWAILATGYDGEVRPPRRDGAGKQPLKAYHVGQDRQVPGVAFPIRTAFDMAQLLTWITSNQRTVEMQVEGTEEIPALMKDLLRFR